MSLNLYEMCPCGSGKKIKYCCSRDLGGDLDRVLRMVEGDQLAAALAKIQTMEKKHPGHPALLALRLEVHRQLNQDDRWAATAEEFLAAAPDNPSAHAAWAQLLASRGQLPEALSALQDALERISDELPVHVIQWTAEMAVTALNSGEVGPAEGLVRLIFAWAAHQVNFEPRFIAQLVMLQIQIESSQGIPLFLKGLNLVPSPEKASWKREYDAYHSAGMRGQFRKALHGLEEMSKRILDEPVILRTQIALNWWLGRHQAAEQALRALARVPTLPYVERVEALAGAQSLMDCEGPKSRWITFALDDLEAARQRLADHPMAFVDFRYEGRATEDDAPPSATFLWLDRPISDKDPGDWTPEDLPESIALLLLYGRQTDRPARLCVSLVNARNGVPDTLRTALDGVLGEELESEEMPGQPVLPHLLRPSFVHLARKLGNHRQLRLARMAVAQRVPQRLADLEIPELGGRPLREVAGDSAGKLAAQAVVLRAEALADQLGVEVDLQAVRDELGLPSLSAPTSLESGEIVSARPATLLRLEPQALSDAALVEAVKLAMRLGMFGTLRRVGREALNRDIPSGAFDKVTLCRQLARLEGLTDEALEYLARGRELDVAQGEPAGLWLADEMELRMLRGETDRAKRLLNEIGLRHMDNPEVVERLKGIFGRFQKPVRSGADAEGESEGSAEAEDRSATHIWTPGGEAGGRSESEPSKLWVPGE